jgi:hypothetical protein
MSRQRSRNPNFDTQLLLELGKINHATSVNLGARVLATSFALNGGGMIALPTIVKLFGYDLKASTGLVLPVSVALFFFVFGLILTWASAGFGYLANRKAADGFFKKFNMTRTPNGSARRRPAAKREIEKLMSQSRLYATLMRVAVTGSLAAFIFGASISAYAILLTS